MPSQGTGTEVKVRLYLEGRLVENALAGVTVSGNTGAPLTAQIELVPTNTIKHILPGTWVHVFTHDPWELNPAGDLSDFKLLFEGVVVSRGINRQDNARNFVINCAGPEIYWVHARQFWLNVAQSGGGIIDQVAIQTSGGYGRFGMLESTGTHGYMNTKLSAIEEQGEEQFLDTLISVLDDIGNVNPFYTNVRNRFRLTDRIIRGPAGNSNKLFQIALLSDFLDGLAGRVSGQTNLAEVVNQLLTSIMHEWVSVPAPPYVTARIFERDAFGNIKRERSTVSRVDRRARRSVELFNFKTAEDEIIASTIFKPHVYTLPPPTCNVLFPNMYDNLSYTEDFLNEPTRVAMRPQLMLGNGKLTQGLLFLRPTELEVFTGLTRDEQRRTRGQRTPDGRYADGAGQAPVFTDYDWATNEERLRGIVYNFMNLAPAPSTLTLSDPGRKEPSGTRKGGMPQYLQNVASYEWFKSKFMARGATISGPYNMRAVPGFPMVALDDSDANLNVIGYLAGITHHIDSDGNATTDYQLKYPRLSDEVDYNRPKFKASSTPGELNFDLFRDENGNYAFEKVFDGTNQPPIPEWFDDSFRNLEDLDHRYSQWFGAKVGVVQNILFKNPDEEEKAAIAQQEAERAQAFEELGIDAVSGADELPQSLQDDIVEANNSISLSDAIKEINDRYRRARDTGREFEQASEYTSRAFTRIDEAFRFVGAAPLEIADSSILARLSGGALGNKVPGFTQNPAVSREINYKRMRLDFFVGDVSPGSGYSGVPEGEQPVEPVTAGTSEAIAAIAAIRGSSAEEEAEQLEAQNQVVRDRMSGAFPVFDTRIHTGDEATDAKTRNELLTSQQERASSSWPRYDGRPLMFDFEFRIWQESLRAAGFAPTGEKIADNAEVADYYVEEGGGWRPATADERAQAAERRREKLEQRRNEQDSRASRGRHDPRAGKSQNMPPSEQAPTGDGLDQEQRLPLPQPLSEKQVVDLRRSIVDAYREELAKNRGFTG